MLLSIGLCEVPRSQDRLSGATSSTGEDESIEGSTKTYLIYKFEVIHRLAVVFQQVLPSNGNRARTVV